MVLLKANIIDSMFYTCLYVIYRKRIYTFGFSIMSKNSKQL